MRSQGTFEYILLLGGIIIVALLVVNTIISSGKGMSTETNKHLSNISGELNNKMNELEQNLQNI